MIFFKNVYVIATSILLLTVNAPAWATPITFEFTGTVTNTVIDTIFGDNGIKETRYPEWNGQQVTGILTLDLEGQWEYFSEDDPYTIYKSFGSVADSNWMQLTLRNPDGTYFDSSRATYGKPTPFNPYPNSAYAQIVHLSDVNPEPPLSNLVVSRGYYDSASPLAYNYIELTLIGNGSNAHLLTSSKDFDDVIINPEFANLQNYGSVNQSNRTLTSPGYHFTIDSFNRVRTEVPEPSAPLLLFSGLLIVLLKRYKLFL